MSINYSANLNEHQYSFPAAVCIYFTRLFFKCIFKSRKKEEKNRQRHNSHSWSRGCCIHRSYTHSLDVSSWSSCFWWPLSPANQCILGDSIASTWPFKAWQHFVQTCDMQSYMWQQAADTHTPAYTHTHTRACKSHLTSMLHLSAPRAEMQLQKNNK